MTESMRGRGSAETKYGRVPLWLYETDAGLQAISAYGWLHGRYGHYDRIMPSYATLAKELKVSRGSVIAYVKALTLVGAIRIETSGAAGRQTNVYAIAFDEPFPMGGQNADHPSQDADPLVSGVHHPSQPTGRGGQPAVQEEDVSTKTFLEDEKLSLPSEPDPVHEREMLSPFEDPHQSEPLPGVDVYTAQLADADAITRVTAAWTEAYKRSSSGSEPSTKAISRVRASATSRLRAGKSADDLVLIAIDMAETNLTWTDLAEHEAHWLHKQQQDSLTGTDATVAGWLQLAGQLGREDDPAFKPSVTDQRVRQALNVGRQLQAEADARRGGGYRSQHPNDAWDHLAQQAAAGQQPDGWERVPFCGHLDCDEITRMRQVDIGDGLKSLTYCSSCHPALKF